MHQEAKSTINKVLMIICLISLVINGVSLFFLFNPGINMKSLAALNPGPDYNFYTSGQGKLIINDDMLGIHQQYKWDNRPDQVCSFGPDGYDLVGSKSAYASCHAKFKTVGEFTLEANVRIKEGSGCAGLSFGEQPDGQNTQGKAYAFLICNQFDPEDHSKYIYALVRYDGFNTSKTGKPTILTNGFTGQLKPVDYNTIAVVTYNNITSLYVNKVQIETIIDTRYPTGWLGVGVSGALTVVFKNIRAWTV